MKRTESDNRFWTDGTDMTFVKEQPKKRNWPDQLLIWVIAFSFMF